MTKAAIRKYAILIVMLVGIPLAFILTFNSMQHNFDALPYYGDFELETQANGQVDTLWKPITHPTLLDEEGQRFDFSELGGDVWVLAFYSTSSPHIAKITERLLNINFKYRSEEDIKIVTVSHKPQFDTPLRRTAYLNDVLTTKAKWRFLSGDEDVVGTWAAEQFGIVDNLGQDATVWLVDDKGYLRGSFNANLEPEISKLVGAIAMAKKEIDLRQYEMRKKQK